MTVMTLNDSFASKALKIFEEATADYHKDDSVDAPSRSHYPSDSVEAILYEKNRIDAVQWHLEDIIRDPEIDPSEALGIKRRIDRLNQQRTDMVENLDTYFLEKFANVTPQPDATVNTESPAWAIDRLSILVLKLWHMEEQAARSDSNEEQRKRAQARLAVLKEQRKDLSGAIDALLADIAAGRKYMKVYRQMKLYNDPQTNPVLYGKKQG